MLRLIVFKSNFINEVVPVWLVLQWIPLTEVVVAMPLVSWTTVRVR